MKSIQNARFVLVSADESDRPLLTALSRMQPRSVTLVPALDEARKLCEAGTVDACLVVIPGAVPDIAQRLDVETEAPGAQAGTPSLLFARVVTPYITAAARRAGYAAAVPVRLDRRMLYRRIGALLQKSARHAQTRGPASAATRMPGRMQRFGADLPDAGKLKLQ
jgi:hypothetical protein